MHAADRHQLIAELDGGVRMARAEDILAKPAPCRGRARLAAFELGLVWRCAGDAALASEIVSRVDPRDGTTDRSAIANADRPFSHA
jgi:hypothetical protein